MDTLQPLDGEVCVVDGAGKFWVMFEVKQVDVSAERPDGPRYSLTLHDEHGERLPGFDNAHPVMEGSGPGARTQVEYDHRHSGERMRFYEYFDVARLLEDFWVAVEALQQERSH